MDASGSAALRFKPINAASAIAVNLSSLSTPNHPAAPEVCRFIFFLQCCSEQQPGDGIIPRGKDNLCSRVFACSNPSLGVRLSPMQTVLQILIVECKKDAKKEEEPFSVSPGWPF
jgi:hypothetical protein